MGHWHEADETVRRYVHLRRCRGDIRAQDLVGLRGALCRHCGGPKGQVLRSNGSARDICVDCRRGWEGTELGVLVASGRRRQLQRGEATAAERRIAGTAEAWLRVARVVEPRPRDASADYWAFVVEAWGIFLHPLVHGRAGVVIHGPQLFPQWSAWWTDWQVRHAIAYGRSKVDRRLERTRARQGALAAVAAS